MPVSEVYLCDKQVDLPDDKGSPCVKALPTSHDPAGGGDAIELLLTVSGGGSSPVHGTGAVYERRFCQRSHAVYWLIRQRLVSKTEDSVRGNG